MPRSSMRKSKEQDRVDKKDLRIENAMPIVKDSDVISEVGAFRLSAQTSKRKQMHISADDNGQEEDDAEHETKRVSSQIRESQIRLAKEFAKIRASILDDNYDEKLQREFQSDSDTDSLGSAPSYTLQKELDLGPDFFDTFSDLHDINDLAEDTKSIRSIKVSRRRTTQDDDIRKRDIGSFVDPLTGEALPSTEETEEEEEESEITIDDEEGEEEEEDYSYEDPELLCLLEADEAEKRITVVDMETDALENFFEIETGKSVVVQEEFDWDAFERAEEHRQLVSDTADFLKELVNKAVINSEYVDPNTILRKKLNKMTIIAELQTKLVELELERRHRMALNRITVEHLRRKKAYDCITEILNPNIKADEMHRFEVNTRRLDQLLESEKNIQIVSSTTIRNLERESASAVGKAIHILRRFEELVKKTLARPTFVRMPTIADELIKQMATTRHLVSDTRFILIQRLHSTALMQQKLDGMNDLGNGLQMRQFENLQTEAQQLDKKIEERNSDLKRIRLHYHIDVHLMAHMKEKRSMLSSKIIQQKTDLDALIEVKRKCRKRLYDLKLTRGRLRRDMHELSYQGGLIDKHALMIDYDQTMVKLIDKRQFVYQLRVKLQQMHSKLENLECEHDFIVSNSTTNIFLDPRMAHTNRQDGSMRFSQPPDTTERRYGRVDKKEQKDNKPEMKRIKFAHIEFQA